MSRVGLGCMSLSASREQEGIQLIHQAIGRGINFLDTADLYEKGLNESLVGKALQGKRQQVILATKVGNQWRPDGSGWDWNPRPAHILASVDASLRRLGTDYFDLYQLHGGTIEDPIDDTIAAFEQLVSQGKIRHYGISSIRPNVIRAYVGRSRITSVMMQYSLLDRRPEEAMLSLLEAHQIGVLVRGALAQGLLIDKPARPYLAHPEAAVERLQQAVRACAGTGRPATDIALHYVLDHPAVTSAVIGMRSPQHLDAALQALDSPRLLPAQRTQLASPVPPLLYTEHRETP